MDVVTTLHPSSPRTVNEPLKIALAFRSVVQDKSKKARVRVFVLVGLRPCTRACARALYRIASVLSYSFLPSPPFSLTHKQCTKTHVGT